MWYGNLQVGRIVAAAGVLFAHTLIHGKNILGVDTGLLGPVSDYYIRTTIVFLFVLSGFVLAHSLQSGSLGSFVGFRLLRLFPAYWAAVAVVMLGRSLAGEPGPPETKLLLRAIFLIPGSHDGPGYHPFYTLGIEWTLVYELFLSMAIVPLAAVGRRWGLGVSSAVWVAACLAYQAVNPTTVPVFPTPAQLLLSPVNVSFLLGVLVYLTHHRWGGLRVWVLLGGVVALTAGMLPAASAPGWSYVLQSVGAAALVGFLTTGRQLEPKHPLAVAGEWSYGVYLLHVPVLVLLYRLVAERGLFPPTVGLLIFGGATAFAVGAVFGEAEWRTYRRVRRAIKARFTPRTIPLLATSSAAKAA